MTTSTAAASSLNSTPQLSQEFIDSYKDQQVPWGPVGYIVYKRTYARRVCPLTRTLLSPEQIDQYLENQIPIDTEEWYETVGRCVNAVLTYSKGAITKEEGENLFKDVFYLKACFSGRGLWQLGTETVEKLGLASLVNCFSGDTEIVTDKGVMKIGGLAGTTVKVMTERGKYVDAPIINFGPQELIEVNLTKGTSRKTVYCTKDHVWYRRLYRHGSERATNGRVKLTTSELSVGDKLISVYGQSIKNIEPSTFGIARGIVFGDGSKQYDKSAIRLCGEKNHPLLKYFNGSRYTEYEGDPIVRNLPSFFKDLPDLSMDKNYLYGWLAGYFAADGHIKKSGSCRLSSANKDHLLFVRDVLIRLGIGYSPITSQMRKGFNQHETPLYSININGSSLTESFFLIEEHRARFVAHRYSKNKLDWTVESISETGRIEDVFCATVPDTHTFALEGNLLTGNCWHVTVDHLEAFTFTFDMLMLGGGVGFNIQKENVYQLPAVKVGVSVTRSDTPDADFIVPDSREGWVDLLRKTFDAFFVTGKSFSYSTICIRSKGAPIRSFGGTASGPEDLCSGLADICAVLRRREGKKLRPIDAMDVLNIIGKIVVAGNVRRSAQVSLGDPDDFHFLGAKDWGSGSIPNWRAMSNNTIIVNDVEHINERFWKGYEGNGEPYGLFNRDLSRRKGRLVDRANKRDVRVEGTNPCVSGSTWVQTNFGPRKVSELVSVSGPLQITLNGETFGSTDLGFFSSGIKETVLLETDLGFSLELTKDHKLLTKEGEWVEAKDLLDRDVRLNQHNNISWEGRGSFEEGYAVGWLIGDGTYHKDTPRFDFYDEKAELAPYVARCVAYEGPIRATGSKSYFQSVGARALTEYFGVTRSSKTITDLCESSSSDFCRGVLSGLFDSDGSVQGSSDKGLSVRLAQTNLHTLEAAQRILLRLGIISKIYKERQPQREAQLPDGSGGVSLYECKPLHELIVSRDSINKFQERVGFRLTSKREKLNKGLEARIKVPYKSVFTAKVTSITPIGKQEVFDIQIPGPNAFDANGIISHNCAEISLETYECCNLTEIFLPNIESPEEYAEISSRLVKINKVITTLPCHWERAQEVVSRNRRLGVGITGVWQAPHLVSSESLDSAYTKIKEKDIEFSKELSESLGINVKPSVKLTTVKPSGTLSLLSGVSPGAHPEFAPFYIRRMRFASDDILVDRCRNAGYPVEFVRNFDGTEDRGTVVISFPVKARQPDNAVEMKSAADYTAIEMLEMVKHLQTYWSDNGVSCTIYYRPEELPEIKEWLNQNYESSLKSVSFLLYSGHNFDQAPLEAIDEDTYNDMQSKLSEIETGIDVGGDLAETLECLTGACPVK